MSEDAASAEGSPERRQRRPRYSGKNPRKFEHKYKERDPAKYPETVAKVIASGKTPVGTHRPIMVDEIVNALAPAPGGTVADCTLGYGGHTRALLERILPGGRLIGLDADPIELPRTEARLKGEGFTGFSLHRSNFAGLPKVLAVEGLEGGVEMILADLGVSSMQLDDPTRGFSVKAAGPLDMRMNPGKGRSAAELIEKSTPLQLEEWFTENADETEAAVLARALAGKRFATTTALASAIAAAHPHRQRRGEEGVNLSIRRVFQALRIAVNEEFVALEMFLRNLPRCLAPGGRAAVLTFHSGEDRRVKKAFEAGLAEGVYASISHGVIRPSAEECHANTRATSAKLRWAIRAV